MHDGYDKQLCVDIILKGTRYGEIFKKKSDGIHERASYGRGIFREETGDRTRFEGQENELFKGIAQEFIKGEILGVDSVLSDGINVSANVTNKEAHHIKRNIFRFRVKGEIDL